MPKKPTAQLTEVSIDEGSLVKVGDNPAAQVRLFKFMDEEGAMPPSAAKSEGSMDQKEERKNLVDRVKGWFGKFEGSQPRTVRQIVAAEELEDGFRRLKFALLDSIRSIMDNAPIEEAGDILVETTTQFAEEARKLTDRLQMSTDKQAELNEILDNLVQPLSGDDEVAKSKRETFLATLKRLEDFNFGEVISKADAAPPTQTKEKETPVTTPKKTLKEVVEDLKKAGVDPALIANVESAKAAEDKPADPPAPPPAPAADDVVAKAVQAAVAPLLKQVEETNAKLQKAEEERLNDQIMAKARDLAVPGSKVEDVAEMLKAAQASGHGEQLEQTLRGMSAQIRQNAAINKIMGRATGVDNNPSSADAELSKLAKEVKKAAPVGKAPSDAHAYVAALDANPDLYTKYLIDHPIQTAAAYQNPGVIIE